METQTLDQTADAPTETVAPSIADHAKQFGPQGEETPTPEPKQPEPAAAEPLKPIRPVDQQKRAEDGKFSEGQRRLNSRDAVSRINQLTGRAKQAEERAERLEQELSRLRQQGAPKAEIAKAEAKVEAAGGDSTDAEPQEKDFEDYGHYLRAVAKWEGRQAYRAERETERAQAAQASERAKQQESLKGWAGRLEAARGRYEDFDLVALAGDTRIPEGSAVDAWIMEHRAGPDVLYYFQSHPHELDSLLRKPVLEQVEDLSLLSQRLLPTSSEKPGDTGAGPRRQSVVLPPRPPTPVRTEAQRASDGPPPTDGSLSIAEHRKRFAPQGRR